jgi:hypothetical protein
VLFPKLNAGADTQTLCNPLASASHTPPLTPCPQAAEYRPFLTTLFSRYVDPCLEYCRRNFKTVVPLPAVNQARAMRGRPLRCNSYARYVCLLAPFG